MKISRKVVIVGGGISGLAAVYRLKELGQKTGQPFEIVLAEATSRLGGVIESRAQDGFLLEGGPDSFISEKPAARELSDRLGIASEIIGTNNKFRRSFIYKKGKLIPIPEGYYLIAPSRISAFLMTPLLNWGTKFRVGCELFISKRKSAGDESVGGFVRRRFGETTLQEIAQPMIGGIYTADPEFLSLETTLPQFLDLERQYGSVIRGLITRKRLRLKPAAQTASGPRYSLFLSFREGMESLTRSISAQLPEVTFRMNAPVAEVWPHSGKWKIAFRHREVLEADVVCIALSAFQAAPLLSRAAPDLSRDLENVPYESVATINLAYKRSDIPHPLNGFGFVVPAITGRKIVACSFSSVKFAGRAPRDMALLRVFAGGALHREVYAMDDKALERTVLEELRHYLGIKAPPLFSSIKRYPNTMPQYRVGHLELMKTVQSKLAAFPGLYLVGNAYRGIGVPDCIKWSELTAESIAQFLEERERLPVLEVP